MAEPILAAGSTWFTQGGTTVKRASITEIEIKDSYTPAGAVTASWDASAAKDGSVMAYVEGTKLIIAGNGSGKVFANPNSSYAFSDSAKKDYFTSVTAINGLNLLNTSKVTDMNNMFRNFIKVTILDVDEFDTSNVTNMMAMFAGSDGLPNMALVSLDVSKWDVSKVQNLTGTFQYCSFTELDVSNWDTSSLTSMYLTFNGCNNLTALNMTNWDTADVTSMQGTFQKCYALTTIGDTTNWNTAACTNMQAMFLRCESLATLNTSNWNVSKVTSMGGMFQNCTRLTTIGDTSNWNTATCKKMSDMFADCTALEELNTSNWDVSKVTTFAGMFSGGNLGNPPMIIKELDVSQWDTSSATNMRFMFYGCKGPKTLDVSSWNVSKVTNFDHMFAHSHLTLTGVDNWAPSTACTNMNAMFHSIQNSSIDVSKYDTSNVTVFDQMFQSANKLTKITGLEKFNTSKGLGFSEMFQYCSSLKELDLSSFDTTKAKDGAFASENGSVTTTMSDMFTGMQRLEKITLGEKFTFHGDGTTTDPSHYAVLPTPSANYIAGADGMWHTTDGKSFSPQDVPSNTAAVYYAVIVPPVTRSPAAIMLGFFVGSAIRRMRWKKKLVAYLYNGVRLPYIYTVYTPEIRETHPYALIIHYQHDDGSSLSLLQVFSKPFATVDLTDKYGYVSVQVLEDGGTYREWEYRSDEYTDWMGANILISSDNWETRTTKILWTNTTIYNPDGSTYLVASDPVPVYE